MLYCPKCRRSFEQGSHRFCPTDGGRLLPALQPATADDSDNGGAGNKAGVFSTVLARRSVEKTTANDEKASLNPPPPLSVPSFLKVERIVEPDLETSAPKPPEIFAAEFEISPNVGPRAEIEDKPAARLIKPSEIASGTASVGDRSVNPAGRSAISRKNPDVLLGQTIKGRYRVAEKIAEDETSLVFLAEDQLTPDRRVVVRVLMEEDADDLASRIFAEERVSLSHLNHPNVAALIDSGELLEGKPFIVSEYAAGESVAEKLRHSGQFNALRAARVVRQIADALSEAHRNGILHRSLKPENIILTVNESGTETVKVTDFAVSDGRRAASEKTAYQSPEQLEGKLPTFASDIYSLAVIAYQMLTGRTPFNAASGGRGDSVAARRQGLNLKPTNLRLDLPPVVDEILEKALAYKPSERFPKARDFGDALFNALTNASTPMDKTNAETASLLSSSKVTVHSQPEPPLSINSDSALDGVEIELIEEYEQPEERSFVKTKAKTETEAAAAAETKSSARVASAVSAEGLPWEKRSPEPVQTAGKSWLRLSLVALLALVLGLWAAWYYFLNQRNQSPVDFAAPPNQTAATQTENAPAMPLTDIAPAAAVAEEIESPPAERKALQPPNTEYFQNTRENLAGEPVKYYRGFSFFYPQDWTKSQGGEKNFVDVARKNENGVPVEQMIVTFYDSKGTFKADGEKFPALVKESNKRLAEQLPNYRFVSEGENNINGGWKIYEMKFEAAAQAKGADAVKIYGRRIFMPAMRPGVKGGLMLTLLATSLSPDVKSADDVGVKGELAMVLKTFEPSQMY